MSMGISGAGGGAIPTPSAVQQMKARGASNDSFENLIEQANNKAGSNDIAKSFLGDTGQAEGDSRKEKLKNTAEKMEGMFVNMMMKEMRETVPEFSLGGKESQGKKMFQARLDRKYAEKMANSKDLGIANAVYEQFTGESMDEMESSGESTNDSGLEMESSGEDQLENLSSENNRFSKLPSTTPRSAFGGL